VGENKKIDAKFCNPNSSTETEFFLIIDSFSLKINRVINSSVTIYNGELTLCKGNADTNVS
jgi:hypothetical protein